MLTVKEEELNELIEMIKIFNGNYNPERQYAAKILIKMYLGEEQSDKLFKIFREDKGFKINNRQSNEVLRWARKVKNIGYCQICGSKKKLCAHHIIGWEDSYTGRTDITNGMCICEKCHKMIHNDTKWLKYMESKYGK